MTKTTNMIQNRIESLEQWGHDGKLNGELFMYSLGEYGFLTELAEQERKDSERALSMENAIHKYAHETITQQKQILDALRMVNKLVSNIENMKYDCDGEVYEALVKLQDILAE